MNRRNFLQSVFAGFGALTLFSSLSRAEGRGGKAAAAGAAKAQLVDPKSSDAKAVNYVHKTTDIKDAKLKTERSGVKFENQKCTGCSFYQAAQESTVDGKKAAPCLMPFAKDKVVAADGWCSTWAKK